MLVTERAKPDIVAVLDEAIRLIKKGGLAKGNFSTKDGRYCMAGAIGQAADNLRPHDSFSYNSYARVALIATSFAIAGSEIHGRSPNMVVMKYNDAFWRMKWQVLRKLEQAKAFV